LEKSVFLKAIAEDRLPHNFATEEVSLFYELMGLQKSKADNYERIVTKSNAAAAEAAVAMDFRSFMFFFQFHLLLNKYSVEKPLQLEQAELLRLLDDPRVPVKIVKAIDHSITQLLEPQHLEASLVHGAQRPNEGQFFAKLFLAKGEKLVEESRDMNIVNKVKNNNIDIADNNKGKELFDEEKSIDDDYRVNDDNDIEEEIEDESDDDGENRKGKSLIDFLYDFLIYLLFY